MNGQQTGFHRLRQRAACVLWIELLLRAVAPGAFIILAYAVLAVFGLGNGWLFLDAALLALAALAWEGVKIRPPAGVEIDRRIEAASGLKHRPLAALADMPATGGELGEAIWQAHQARTAKLLDHAHAGWPAPFVATRDPFSLRALLLLLLATGVVVAGNDAPARLGAAFAPPAWPFAGPRVNVWITPPAYTGEAPALLIPGVPVSVLIGTKLSVILDGSTDAIRLGGKNLPETVLGEKSRRADGVINASGTLSIGPWWHRLGHWRITAMPPAAPVLRFDPIGLDNGAIKLSWAASDPYGLASLAVAIHPPGYPDALPEGAALPAATGPGQARLDARDSPYGGIAVALTLQAVSLAGVSTTTTPQTVILPSIALHDPTAIVLSIIRQNLALTPGQSPAMAGQMMRVAQTPPSAISYSADAQLAELAAALRIHATSPRSAVNRLLALVKQIEAGPDFAPSQALAQAAEKLLQALAHGPLDANTLNKLLQAMQQALAQHLAAIRPAASGQSGAQFDTSVLNRMAEKIAADEKAGRTQQAAAELQQLARTLQALQTARPMSAAQAAQAQAAAQATKNLAQLIQEQAALLDKTAKGNATPASQGQLQSSLKGIAQALDKAGIPGVPGIGPAAQAMATAQTALARQNNRDAQTAEAAAIKNLQKAAAALQNSAQPSLSLGAGGTMPDQNLDGSNGTSEDLSIPGLNLPASNPANAIEQEIIRRDANPSLPPATHHYLHRLLTPDP